MVVTGVLQGYGLCYLCSDGQRGDNTESAVQVGENVPLEEGQGGEEAPEDEADGEAGGLGHQGQVEGDQGAHVHVVGPLW